MDIHHELTAAPRNRVRADETNTSMPDLCSCTTWCEQTAAVERRQDGRDAQRHRCEGARERKVLPTAPHAGDWEAILVGQALQLYGKKSLHWLTSRKNSLLKHLVIVVWTIAFWSLLYFLCRWRDESDKGVQSRMRVLEGSPHECKRTRETGNDENDVSAAVTHLRSTPARPATLCAWTPTARNEKYNRSLRDWQTPA